VPFPSYDEAVKWVLANTMSNNDRSEDDLPELNSGIPTIIYFGERGPSELQPTTGSKLHELLVDCKGTAEQFGPFGLDVNSLVFFVLADIPPFFTPIEVTVVSTCGRLPTNRLVPIREATIKIREGFTFEQLRWAYERVRRELKLTKKKSLGKKHLLLYRLVRQTGKLPQGKGTVAFWTAVMLAWNRSNPKDKYKSWKGIRLAYDRIVGKINQ
jgi:hypothetical protein